MSVRTGRRFCFTLNNYTEAEISGIQQSCANNACIRFLVYGREVGQHGVPHLQGYMELDVPKRPGAVKALLATDRVHIENAAGSAEQNRQYCSKEDADPFTHGTPSRGQGARNDLSAVCDLVTEGANLARIFQEHPTVVLKYHKGIQRCIELRSVPREHQTQFIWRFGSTGTGKSRDTHNESKAMSNNDVSWLSDVSCQWFDGYVSGSRGAVLDEFDGSVKLRFLLRLLDRYPIKVPIKGGFVEWNPRIVWITSQFSPEHYYGADEQWLALVRRFRDFGVAILYGNTMKTEFNSEYWSEILTRERGFYWSQ